MRVELEGKKGIVNIEVKDFEELKAIAKTLEVEEVSQIQTPAKELLSRATDRYFYFQARAKGGYLNMGEIVHDAGEGDPDAQFLLKLYDAIWGKEEELEEQIDSMTLEELFNLNIEAWVKPLYDQIVAELENAADSTTDNTSEG